MNMLAPRRGLGDLSLDRSKQINTLLIFNENVSEIKPNLQYRVDFMSGGQPLALVILLPPDFPKDRPTIFVEPRAVRHPWLREDGAVVGAPGLVSFGIHSDLGRVVQAIKRELEKNPPYFPAQYQNSLEASQRGGGPPIHNSNLVNGVPPPFLQQQQQQQQQPAAYPIRSLISSILPISDSSFHQLTQLSLEELQELDENPTALKIFVRSLVATEPSGSETESKEVRLISMVDAKLSEIRRQIDALITERRHLAEQVESKRASLLEELDTYHATRGKLADATSAIKENRSRYSLRNLCDLMQQSSVADEEQSEKFAENFLAGNLDVDQFVAGYIQVRSAHHKKKVAAERIGRSHK